MTPDKDQGQDVAAQIPKADLRAIAAGEVRKPIRPLPEGAVWAGPVDADGYPMPEEGQ